MEAFTPYLIDILAPLTLLLQGTALVLLGMLLRNLIFHASCSGILHWISRQSLLLMFSVSLGAMLGSMFFSEIAMWIPCKYCWYQRIFLYPQILLLGLALWKRDRGIIPYILLLSIVGMIFSLVHYVEQLQSLLYPEIFDPTVPCDLTGVSCRSTELLRYGFITIPYMAMAPFFLNIVLSFITLRCGRNGK